MIYLVTENLRLFQEASRNEEVSNITDGPISGIRIRCAICKAGLFRQTFTPGTQIQAVKPWSATL